MDLHRLIERLDKIVADSYTQNHVIAELEGSLKQAKEPVEIERTTRLLEQAKAKRQRLNQAETELRDLIRSAKW